LKKIFKTDIDEDGFVRLPIRVYGPNGKSVRLVGIVDTASSYVIIPPFVCELLHLEVFDQEKPEVSILTGSGFIKAPLRKAVQVEIVGSQFREEDVAVVCHFVPRGISILGYSFLKNYKVSLDWKRGVFTLESAECQKA